MCFSFEYRMSLLHPPETILRLLEESLPPSFGAPSDSKKTTTTTPSGVEDEEEDEVLSYVAFLAAGLAEANEFNPSVWNDVLTPYLQDSPSATTTTSSTTTTTPPPPAQQVVETFRQATERAFVKVDDEESVGEEDEDVEEVCNIRFNLAYGGKILLHNTKLRLLRGRRYALVGQNGVGKTTLMNAINSGKLEGWPVDILKTAYVDSGSNVDPIHEEQIVLQYIMESSGRSRQDCVVKLQELDFTDDMLEGTIGALSGGWQMKMRLVLAV